MKVDSTSPLHHPPAAAVGIIVVTLAITIIAMIVGETSFESFTLQYGKGLIPVQWLTSTFVHPNILVLLSTLIPLGFFAVFLEGKVGPPVFVIAFLAISFTANAAGQFLMKDFKDSAAKTKIDTSKIKFEGRDTPYTEEEKKILAEADKERLAGKGTVTIAPGASAAVFGLMMICMIWAPTSSLIFGGKSDRLEIPMILPVILFIGAEVGKWYLVKFSLSGLPMHLLGIGPGLALGGFFVAGGFAAKTSTARPEKTVAEPQDLTPEQKYERRQERKQQDAKLRQDRRIAARQKEQLLRESAAIVKPRQEQQVAKADPLIDKARESLESGEPIQAFEHLMQLKYAHERKHFKVEEFNQIAQHYVQQKDWNQVVVVLKESIAAHESDAIEHQLQLAKIYLAMKRPDDCQARLGKIPRKELTPKQQERYRELVLQLRRIA
ncbi:MAG: rhomboid family intramembrane serine protease [Planctomycetota bacterium]